MNIRIANEGDKSTVYLSGSIDIPGAENLKKAFNQITENNPNLMKLTSLGVPVSANCCCFIRSLPPKAEKCRSSI